MAEKKVEGAFGNSAQALSYERRIIAQLQAWGVHENPSRYIRYTHTEEVPDIPGGGKRMEACELCGHPLIYVQVCEQTGPGDIMAQRRLGCDCILNYGVVTPSEARLAELRTKDLQKEAAKRSKAQREAARKIEYAEKYKDVLDYIALYKQVHGSTSYRPPALFYAQIEITKARYAEKKMETFITPARAMMEANPLDEALKAHAEQDKKDQKELNARRKKYAEHLKCIKTMLEREPDSEFWRSMDIKFLNYTNDVRAWEPSINMVASVERQINKLKPQDEDTNLNRWGDEINRVEKLAHVPWGVKKSFFGGAWQPSQTELFDMLDDIAGKLVEQGDFSSQRQKDTFYKLLEKLERFAKSKEEKR